MVAMKDNAVNAFSTALFATILDVTKFNFQQRSARARERESQAI